MTDKPTIHELEAILDEPAGKVEILPGGEVVINDELTRLRAENERLQGFVGRCKRLHPPGEWTYCACRFDEKDHQTNWCGVHSDLRDENERLREALKEISKGEGPFSRDPLEHAGNVIDSMKNIATEALIYVLANDVKEPGDA